MRRPEYITKTIRAAGLSVLAAIVLSFSLCPATAEAARDFDIFEIDVGDPGTDLSDDVTSAAYKTFSVSGSETWFAIEARAVINVDPNATVAYKWEYIPPDTLRPTTGTSTTSTPASGASGASVTCEPDNAAVTTVKFPANTTTQPKTYRIKVTATATATDPVSGQSASYEQSRLVDIIQGPAEAAWLRTEYAAGSGPIMRDRQGKVFFDVNLQDINGNQITGPIIWLLSDPVDFTVEYDATAGTYALALTPTGKLNGNELFTTVQATIQGVTASKVFEVLYQPDDETEDKLLITFDSNISAVNPVTRATVVPGFPSKYVVVGRRYGFLPSVERTGYHLVGWYTEATGGQKVTADTRVPMGKQDHTLYAHWVMSNQVPALTKVNTANGDYQAIAEGTETATDGIFTLTAVKTGNGTARLNKLSGAASGKVVIAASLRVSGSHFTVNQIKKRALAGKRSVSTLIIPSTVEIIGKEAFSGMSGLNRIEINAASLKTVKQGAFKGIRAGTRVVITAPSQKKYSAAVSKISAAGGSGFLFQYQPAE